MICGNEKSPSAKEIFDHVLKSDVASETKTTFRLHPLTVREANRIKDILATRSPTGVQPLMTLSFEVCRFGIVGWDRMVDLKNTTILFEVDSSGYITDEILARFPTEAIVELSNVIMKASEITEEDAKN